MESLGGGVYICDVDVAGVVVRLAIIFSWNVRLMDLALVLPSMV